MKDLQKSIKDKEKQIKTLQRDIEELKEESYCQEIEFKDKIFRIYKWENKPVRDFKYPDGFRMAEFQEFVDLIDNNKVDLGDNVYFVKHFFKKYDGKKVSALCRVKGLVARYWNLADVFGAGSIVCVKEEND